MSNESSALAKKEIEEKVYNEHMAKYVKMKDEGLRKISISTMKLLVEQKGDEFTFNQEMVDFLRAISSKYRIYLLTNVAANPEQVNENQLKKLKELLN